MVVNGWPRPIMHYSICQYGRRGRRKGTACHKPMGAKAEVDYNNLFLWASFGFSDFFLVRHLSCSHKGGPASLPPISCPRAHQAGVSVERVHPCRLNRMPSHFELDVDMSNGLTSLCAGAGSTTTASTKQGRKGENKTIEQRYQKKTPIEHILLRPESYIGSVQLDSQTVWVWNEEDQRMVYKQITFAPGLFKIFGTWFKECINCDVQEVGSISFGSLLSDEILVNAADVKARETQERCGNVSQKMTNIKVEIDCENKLISVSCGMRC